MKNVKFLFLMIVIMASMGQVTADLYLPSLPTIAQNFHVSVDAVQFTVTLYMVGFAFSQLIYGPISDALGRKTPLLVGLAILLVGSIFCVTAQSLSHLLIGRLLQGLGAGSGFTLSRSVLRDSFDAEKLVRYSSYLLVFNICLMASAPLLGGYIEMWFGWRANFLFLTLYILSFTILVIFTLNETNQHRHADHLKLSVIKNNLRTLCHSRHYLGYSLIIFVAYGAILAWLTEGPVLLQVKYGYSPSQFGWIAFAVGMGYGIVGIINAQLAKHLSITQLITIGSCIMLVATYFLCFTYVFELPGIFVVISIGIFVAATSLVFPNVFAGALAPFPTIAGIASCVFGFIEILGGVTTSSLISNFPSNSSLPLASIFMVSSLVTLIMIRYLSHHK